MKEIKAYLHRHRVPDVVRALGDAGFRDLCVLDIKGLMHVVAEQENDFPLKLDESIIADTRLELICEDRHVFLAIKLIADNARTGQVDAGWIYVSRIEDVLRISNLTWLSD